jgi:RNA polymerase sigma-70 factor (ECF subfamily)
MARTAATATTDHEATAAGPLTPEEAGRWLSDLFEQHGRMVYGVCRVLLRDPQDAEDASQQTFLSAHRSLLAGTRPRDPAAWLGTIARNECRERIRARAAVPLALAGDPAAPVQLDDVTGGREEVEALCAALAELPPQQREAIVLREFYGLSYDEVRAALGVTDSAVESLIFRARKRLQKELRPARAASGALALPVALHSSLARAVPGFAGAHRAGILAKLASAPVAAKLAAATLAVTVAGVVGTAAVQRPNHHGTHAVRPRVEMRPLSAPTSPMNSADLVSVPPGPESPPVHRADGRAGATEDSHGGGAAHHEQGGQDEPAAVQDNDQEQSDVSDDSASDDTASDSGSGDANVDGGDTDAGSGDSGDQTANRSSGGDGDGDAAPADGQS